MSSHEKATSCIASAGLHTFKEFIVDFNDTGKTVKEINKALLAANIFGGKDISREFPVFGQSALYCITEMHTREDIDNYISHLNLAPMDIFFEPCTSKDMIRRLFRNLMVSFDKIGDHYKSEEVKLLLKAISDGTEIDY